MEKKSTKKGKHIALSQKQVKEVYDIIVKILNDYRVPIYYYSIGKCIDDCVCFEYKREKWIVYEGYRGHKSQIRTYDSPYSAGCELLGSLVADEDTFSEIKANYKRELASVVNLDDETEKKIKISGIDEDDIVIKDDNSKLKNSLDLGRKKVKSALSGITPARKVRVSVVKEGQLVPAFEISLSDSIPLIDNTNDLGIKKKHAAVAYKRSAASKTVPAASAKRKSTAYAPISEDLISHGKVHNGIKGSRGTIIVGDIKHPKEGTKKSKFRHSSLKKSIGKAARRRPKM